MRATDSVAELIDVQGVAYPLEEIHGANCGYENELFLYLAYF